MTKCMASTTKDLANLLYWSRNDGLDEKSTTITYKHFNITSRII